MKVVVNLKLGDHVATLVEGTTSDRDFYQDVLSVRKQSFMKGKFYHYVSQNMVVSDCDPYSKIYCLYLKNDPLGTVTVTLGTKGKMHKEHRFSETLLKTPRYTMCSIQKFCVDEERMRLLHSNPLTLYRQVMRVLEQKAREEGVRTVAVSTAISLHKFQMALGYTPVAGSEYQNEVNHTECLILLKEL
ncbi:MAG: hypothetical protein AAGC43_17405 [Bacteroidota bacterium]